jgi:beta-lactamase superfamily II metal-dependent hydrolase
MVWSNIYAHASGNLTVAFLDVGQGDSIYIESPTGTQVVIDSGVNRAVLRELARVMPLFDTSLDMIMGTHPDADHIGGFPDILARYSVGRAVYQHVDNTPGPADRFEQELVKLRLQKESVTEKNAQNDVVVEPHRGDVWDIGGGAYIVVHYPDRAGDEKDTNAGSMIVHVVYGTTSFLLTGDSPQEVEEYVVHTDGEHLKSDVLKLGHHGSHTSTSPLFLAAVKPLWAVISRGCDNTYGHPHKDVLELVANFKISVLDTCTEGTIVFESDGERVYRK